MAFVKHYLRVFPRDQILFLKFEDVQKNTTKAFQQISNHLKLPRRKAPQDEKLWINSADYNLTVLQSTKELLAEFYTPYNQALAELLLDSKWLWKDSK